MIARQTTRPLSEGEFHRLHEGEAVGHFSSTAKYLLAAFGVSILVSIVASGAVSIWYGSFEMFFVPVAVGTFFVLILVRVLDRARGDRVHSETLRDRLRVIEAEVRFAEALSVIDIPREECEFDELIVLRVESAAGLYVALPCLERLDPEEWGEERFDRVERDYRGWYTTRTDAVSRFAVVTVLDSVDVEQAEQIEHVVMGEDSLEVTGSIGWDRALELRLVFDLSELVAQELVPERPHRKSEWGVPGVWYAGNALGGMGPI